MKEKKVYFLLTTQGSHEDAETLEAEYWGEAIAVRYSKYDRLKAWLLYRWNRRR